MPDYTTMTSEQLFEAFCDNVRAQATALRTAIGDGPMPDPREMADQLAEMTLGGWDEMWLRPDVRQLLSQNTGVMKALGDIQLENAEIVKEMIRRNQEEDEMTAKP